MSNDRDQKMVELSAAILKAFPNGGFVLIVHDAGQDFPIVVDNYADREGALSLVLSVEDGYRQAHETPETGRLYEVEVETGAMRRPDGKAS